MEIIEEIFKWVGGIGALWLFLWFMSHGSNFNEDGPQPKDEDQ